MGGGGTPILGGGAALCMGTQHPGIEGHSAPMYGDTEPQYWGGRSPGLYGGTPMYGDTAPQCMGTQHPYTGGDRAPIYRAQHPNI